MIVQIVKINIDIACIDIVILKLKTKKTSKCIAFSFVVSYNNYTGIQNDYYGLEVVIMEKVTATRKEIAQRYGVCLATLDGWLHRADNPLPHVKAGKKVLISISAADRWFEAEGERIVER